MATTSTAFTACDAVLKLANDVAVLVNISGSTSNVDVNFDNKIGEFRVFGDQFTQRIACGKDSSITIKGIATTGAGEIRDLIENWFFNGSGKRTFQLNMPSEAAGSIRYQVSVLLKTFSFSGDAGAPEPVMYNIELACVGAATRTVI